MLVIGIGEVDDNGWSFARKDGWVVVSDLSLVECECPMLEHVGQEALFGIHSEIQFNKERQIHGLRIRYVRRQLGAPQTPKSKIMIIQSLDGNSIQQSSDENTSVFVVLGYIRRQYTAMVEISEEILDEGATNMKKVDETTIKSEAGDADGWQRLMGDDLQLKVCTCPCPLFQPVMFDDDALTLLCVLSLSFCISR